MNRNFSFLSALLFFISFTFSNTVQAELTLEQQSFLQEIISEIDTMTRDIEQARVNNVLNTLISELMISVSDHCYSLESDVLTENCLQVISFEQNEEANTTR